MGEEWRKRATDRLNLRLLTLNVVRESFLSFMPDEQCDLGVRANFMRLLRFSIKDKFLLSLSVSVGPFGVGRYSCKSSSLMSLMTPHQSEIVAQNTIVYIVKTICYEPFTWFARYTLVVE